MNKEEYTTIKINTPLITLDETIALDNYLNEIVKEITELHLHDKDLALLQETIKRLQHELEQEIIKKEKLRMHIMLIKETIEVWDLDYKDGYVDFEIPKKIKDVVFRSESDE